MLVALFHNGLWATPNLAFLSLIAENPGTNPFHGALTGDYLLTDVSMTGLAAALGQTSPHEVARLHLVVLVVCWAAVVALARHRFGYGTARNLTVLLAAAPVVTVSMQWLGQPDPLTAMAGMAMVLVRPRWAVAVLGVLVGLTHPEQGVFMAATAATVRCFLPDGETTRPDAGTSEAEARPVHRAAVVLVELAVGVSAVAAGRLLTQIWFWVNDMVIATPRTAYLRYGAGSFWHHHSQAPGALLWSLWGPLWFVVAGLAAVGISGRSTGSHEAGRPGNDRHLPLVLGVLALLAVIPMLITLDETRVYAVITAPLLVGAGLAITHGPFTGALRERVVVRASVALLVVTAMLPGVMVTGTPSWRQPLETPDMARFLVDGRMPLDAGDNLTGWLLSPYDFVIPEPPS